MELNLQEAIKRYDIKQYDQALPTIKRLVKKNDPIAHYYYGLMALSGLGMKKDETLAFQSFDKSAKELNPQAIYMCGICYQNGHGVEQNLAKAFEFFQTAHQHKVTDATLQVALCYEEGLGVEKNIPEAIKLYAQLARNEHAFAAYKIGMAYLEGRGVQKSPENAFSWLNKALSYGSIDAMNQFRLIGTKSKTDVRTTQMMATIGLDYLKTNHPHDALIYFQIAANEGDVSSLKQLKALYENGLGVNKDAKTAFDYCLKAANAQDVESMVELGRKYEMGSGVASSFVLAAEWYEKAAAKGYQPAIDTLRSLRGY